MFTFPFSPLPAGTERFKSWGESNIRYDSGEMQGLSPYIKPLYDYSMPLNNYNDIKQSSLWAFLDLVKGQTSPFLMKDPYDYRVNSVLGVASGPTTGSFFLFDTNSYMVRADTTTIGSLFSSISGFVKLGTNFNYDQDSGVLTLVTKANSDVWGVRSMAYFKKVKFMSDFREKSPIWNVFAGQLTMSEMP